MKLDELKGESWFMDQFDTGGDLNYAELQIAHAEVELDKTTAFEMVGMFTAGSMADYHADEYHTWLYELEREIKVAVRAYVMTYANWVNDPTLKLIRAWNGSLWTEIKIALFAEMYGGRSVRLKDLFDTDEERGVPPSE